jgi:hypothetical protein
MSFLKYSSVGSFLPRIVAGQNHCPNRAFSLMFLMLTIIPRNCTKIGAEKKGLDTLCAIADIAWVGA